MLVGLFVGLALTLPAWAQPTPTDPVSIGDLLARGGKRLTKDELVTLLAGATLSGKLLNRPGVTFESDMKSDGTVSGSARSGRDLVGLMGTWSVNDQGIVCTDVRNSSGDKVGGCSVYFVLDGSYFSAPAPAEDKGAPVIRRVVKR